MPTDEGELLADLIKRKLQVGLPEGRTKDRHVDTTPTAEMERYVFAIVKRRRDQASHRPLAKGQLDKWIIEILDDLGEQGELNGLRVSADRIKEMLSRGQKKRSIEGRGKRLV